MGGGGRTMNLECLARLGFDPLAIDVGDVFLEEGRVFELESEGCQRQLIKILHGSGSRG